MKQPLTPEEKLHKKQRDNLQSLCNRIASAHSFGKLKTWQDVYLMEGIDAGAIQRLYPDTYNKPLTFAELKAHFESLKKQLEDNIAGRKKLEEEKKVAPAPVTLEVPLEPEPIDETGMANEHDYGLHSSDKENTYLFWFQKKVVKEMYDDIVKRKATGLACLASTGTGKTFMMGALVRRLVDIKFTEGKTFGSTHYLYVTRATIVEQTKRVFEQFFNLTIKDGVEILNIEQLRSRAGQVWIQEEVTIQGGQEIVLYKWRKLLNPVVIIWDECQALKNDDSIQHKIAAAFNDVTTQTHQLFVSATPFTRVSEAKCFAVSTKKDISHILGLGTPAVLTNSTWPTYAVAIASPSPPHEYNEAAVERLTKDLDKYIKRVRGVRPQFDAINSINMISFQTREERQFYESAWERYLEEKARLEKEAKDKGDDGVSGFMILVQFLKFRMAAEYCRREYLAKAMFDAVQNGKAAVAALNFKGTIISVVKLLIEKYGIPRSRISLVWGGGQTQLTKKQKVKQELKDKAGALAAAGLSIDEMMDSLDLDEVDDRILEDLPEEYRLGPQSKEERQREIDKFQSGKTLFCLYTFRAGGVGLSLHHTDELSKVKVRRKKNGYAVVEDIPNIPIRPRINFVAPTYSAIELVQGLGRCPRLTSLSNTEQQLLFYRGTIEDDVARIVSQKLRCLTRVVRMRESWQDVVVGGVSADTHIKNTEGQVDNPDDLNAADGEEEEEEEE